MQQKVDATSKILSSTEARYYNLIRDANDGIFILRDDLILFCNQKFLEMTGRTKNELKEEGVFYKIFSPDDAETIRKNYSSQILQETVPQRYEVAIISKTGDIHQVEISPSVIEFEGGKATQNIARDITERKEIELKITESEKKYRSLVEQANDGFFILQDGKFRYTNQKFQQMLGYDADELESLRISEILPSSQLTEIKNLGPQTVSDHLVPPSQEITFITKSGSLKVFDMSSVTTNYKDSIATVNIVRDITERKELEYKFRQYFDFLEKLIINSAEGIITYDLDGNIAVYNKGAESILAYKASEVLGGKIHISNLFSEEELQEIETLLHTKNTYNKGKLQNLETLIKNRYNNKVPIRLSATLLYDDNDKEMATVLIFRDLSEELRLKNSLIQSESKYRNLVEQANDGIFIYQDDSFVFTNRRFQEMLSYNAFEFRQISLENILLPQDYNRVTRIYHLLRENPRSTPMSPMRLTMIDRHGEEKEYELKFSTIQFEKRLATQNTVRDITEQKMLEMQLLQSNKMAALGELSGGLAHQLNNPLVGVVNLGQLLLSRMDAKDRNRKLVDSIVKAGKECSNIIKNLLRFSRESQYNFDFLDINNIIDSALTFSERHLSNRGIELKKLYEKNLPKISGNETQLMQVFLNFIHNASQAMPDGGELQITTTLVNGMGKFDEMNHYHNKKVVRIDFKDNGVGIPEKYLRKVFDPFFTTKDTEKGTGLGLSVAYGIIEGHQGRITVHSKENEGSVFSIYLPSGEDYTSKEPVFIRPQTIFKRLFGKEDHE